MRKPYYASSRVGSDLLNGGTYVWHNLVEMMIWSRKRKLKDVHHLSAKATISPEPEIHPGARLAPIDLAAEYRWQLRRYKKDGLADRAFCE